MMKKILFNLCLLMAFFSQATFAQTTDCECDFTLDFVCVFTDDGEQVIFPNACFAACEGYTADQLEACDIDIEPTDCLASFYFDVIDSLTFEFTDASVGATSWSWDFGDGNMSTDQNPTHTYTEAGEYEVTLTIDGDSCSSTTVELLYVGNPFGDCGCDLVLEPVCISEANGEIAFFPNACFAICAGFTESDFGDCDGPIDPTGCYAYFSYGPDESNALTINFSNQSSGEATSWSWDFGDGNTSTEENPTHTYAAEGNYDVTLSISGEDCESTTIQHICVGEVPPFDFCQAFFDYELQPGNTVSFTSFSFVENITSWAWDFGDGNTSTEETPTHTYAEEGEYLVTLTIEADSCTSTIELPVYVGEIIECLCDNNYAPVCVNDVDGNELTFINACVAECEGYDEADFIECENIPVDCECDFTFDFVCALDPATGVILTFPNACWAACEGFGEDALVECDNNPGECECDNNYDPVCVLDDEGNEISFPNACWAACEGFEETDLVECNDIPGDCECDFTFEFVCVVDAETGETLTFPNACFAACEGYEEADLVECDNGWPIDCYTSFYHTQDDPSSLTLNFISDNWENNIVSWSWDFGDGNTSTEENPTHTYAAEGIYDVTLTTTTEDGCESSYLEHICLGDGGVIDFPFPDCQAFFFFVQGENNASEFQFINFSFGEGTSWAWDFGDGNTSTEQNPTHTYSEAGEYEVTLTVSSEDCESSLSMMVATDEDVWYNNECASLFIPLVTPNETSVSFINLSAGEGISYNWDFGDGTTSDEVSPTHEYAALGSYEVTLTTTNADGCVNSITMTVDLLEGGFTANANSISETTTSTVDTELLKQVSLFPNPVVSQLSIQFTVEDQDEYQVEIIDLSGKVLTNKIHQIRRGENTIKLNVANLPSGLYFAKLTNGKASSNLKFVK